MPYCPFLPALVPGVWQRVEVPSCLRLELLGGGLVARVLSFCPLVPFLFVYPLSLSFLT